MSDRARTILVVALTALIGVGGGLAAIFALRTDSRPSNVRILNPDEQKVLELQGDLSALDYKSVPQYNSVVEALVTHNNGYRAVQIQETSKIGDGIVLFAQCSKGQTLQECAATAPTVDKPHIYISVTRNSKQVLLANDIVGYVAGVSDSTTVLTCAPTSPFQPNPYSVRQVPNVFRAFSTGGIVRSGDMDVDFGNKLEEFYPAQGLVRWHCDAKAA